MTNQKQYTNHYQKECKHTFHVALNLAVSLPLANKKETLPFEQGFSRRRLAKAGVAELQKALAKYRIYINLKKSSFLPVKALEDYPSGVALRWANR